MINSLVWGLAVSRSAEPSPGARRSPLLSLLTGLLAVEAAAVVVLTLYLVFELLTSPADSFAAAVALIVVVALAAIWLIAIVVGALRRQPWIRGAAVTWQLVQIAVAVGAFQGIFARPDIGWLLLVPSLAVLALLFSPPVVDSLRRD
jgi:hypothetical protein